MGISGVGLELGDFLGMWSPFIVKRGRASGRGLEQYREVVGWVSFEPGLNGGDARHDRVGLPPLLGQLLDNVVAPVRIGNFHVIVEVEKGGVCLAPGPIGELRGGGVWRAIARSMQSGWREAILRHAQ